MAKVASKGHYWARSHFTQPAAEGGLGHFDVARHLRSGWHQKGIHAATNADRRPAKNFLAYYIRQAMPELRLGREALAANLLFAPVLALPAGSITGRAKRIFEELSSAPTIRPCPRYGSNNVQSLDRGAGVTGLKQHGAVLYRATPRRENSPTIRGIHPWFWKGGGGSHITLRRVVDTVSDDIGHLWTSKDTIAALHREWVRRTDPNDRQVNPADSTITLTALWTVGAGEHSLLDLSLTIPAARLLKLKNTDPLVKKTVSSRAVVIRYNIPSASQATAPSPAIDADGVLSELEVALADLPSRPTCRSGTRDGAPLPLSTFVSRLDHRVSERIAEWQRDVRVIMHDRLARTCTDGRTPTDAASLDPVETLPHLWRFDEVKSQPLHGNVHLVPSSPLSGRLNRETEARCLKVAKLGVRTVLDLLINETDGAGPDTDTG